MTPASGRKFLPDGSSYQGFSLENVTWGYRDLFRAAIDQFFRAGLIGPGREGMTRKFFDFMKCAGQTGFDSVVKEFLASLNPRTSRLLALQDVFTELLDIGQGFGESKLYYGTTFFRLWGGGAFGSSPAEVRNLIAHLRRLRAVDEELAIAFLKGYRRLADRLEPAELEEYVDCGLKVFRNSRAGGLSFMEGILRSSEETVRGLARECRLTDVRPTLKALLRALSGDEVEVGDLGHLDSDVLLDRGTNMVCMGEWLYLPQRCRRFGSPGRNRSWYMLAGITAAGMLSCNSLPRLHGHPDCESARDVVGPRCLDQNLFAILEYLRVLRWIRRHWPGAARLLAFGLRAEGEERPAKTPPEQLFFDAAASERPATRGAELANRIAGESANLFDTTARLGGEWVRALLADYPGLDRCPLRPFSFLPDFLYPGRVDTAPPESLVADLKSRAPSARARETSEAREERDRTSVRLPGGSEHSASADEEKEGEPRRTVPARYTYDEWSQREGDYYRNYCLVYERAGRGSPSSLPDEVWREAKRARRLFELLRPELARREKRLPDGDIINHERLADYLVNRRCGLSPKVDFYERPRVRERDLAVLILLDASGSTRKQEATRTVIEIEKYAAFVLGHALATLRDRFAVCGFSSQGRENCEYLVYKDFAEGWHVESRRRILSATSMNSTRMGPALRHSGYRLSQVKARTRLIMLITDGKPMDSGYDPNTQYAQHDVRMACEENRRLNICTFCVCIDENPRADLEIMFPGKRFAILSNVEQIPRLLPAIYARMTKP